MQEREVLKLSSLYAKKAEHISLELETLVLNVNVGYNKILMERCRQLSDYAQFVSEVRKRLSKKIPLSGSSERSRRGLHPKRDSCRVPEQKPCGGDQSEYL